MGGGGGEESLRKSGDRQTETETDSASRCKMH